MFMSRHWNKKYYTYCQIGFKHQYEKVRNLKSFKTGNKDKERKNELFLGFYCPLTKFSLQISFYFHHIFSSYGKYKMSVMV